MEPSNAVCAVLRDPRHRLRVLAAACAGMFAFGLYLQHVVGLEPCPMCIVQRYALIGVGLLALLAGLCRRDAMRMALTVLAVGSAGFGAFTAARQTWLQWYPPEVYSCGRDFYGVIESFPLRRAIPMIFRGTGDCTQIDWTFLGLSLANWSFIAFMGMTVWLLAAFKRSRQPAEVR